jgi:tetratricopeptide (TPR) repeat protein
MQEFLNSFASRRVPLQDKLDITVGYLGMLPNQQLEPKLFQLTDSLLKAHPTRSDVFAMRGDLLMELDQKSQARQFYHQALERNEGNFILWQNILSIGLELGRYDSVAKESEQALALFPNQAVLYYFAGTANLSINKYDRAIRNLEQGLRLSRNNPDLAKIFNTHLGDAYNSAKKYSQSNAAYDAVLAADPHNAYVLNNYSYYLALRKENLDLAQKMSEDLVETYPDEPNYLDTYAWVLFQKKNYQEALKVLEKALASGGNENGTILEHYGDILYQLGQPERALEQWLAAESLGETSAQLPKKIKDRTYYE